MAVKNYGSMEVKDIFVRSTFTLCKNMVYGK